MSRLLNTSKTAIDENRKSSKILKCRKSVSGTGRKPLSNTVTEDRLVGGADVSETSDEVSSISTGKVEESFAKVEEKDASQIEKPPTIGGPCCSCIAQMPGCVGDKKIDEMIDLVEQNLQEAGKALSTLGENFEHDSKLMFVDILGRIQQWTVIVEKKLEDCRKALELMRRELMARLCEIENLKKKLAECEEEKNRIEMSQREVENKAQVVEETVVEREPEKQEPEKQEPEKQEPEKWEGGEMRRLDVIVEKPSQQQIQEPQVVEIICTDAAIQAMMKDKDRMRRELELEAEIARLKKENQRIIKERAEYENAIQRALLRGVSCLNVEALRVLKSPPIPCCTPCSPCPPGNMERTVCKRDVPNGMSKNCVTHRGSSGKCARESVTVKRPCGSECCSSNRNRKTPSANSMVFLLHQGDAENLCISDAPPPRVCGQPVMKKIEIPPCPRF
ncbi:uncharacterized protein LOC143207301 [Lasioglossum baleicum]|uniref:uncharacterized protein LOC143207301 n=1 Tax=Lasioglossum baleicum TaxID=434251 RepID=UPI003FCC59D5